MIIKTITVIIVLNGALCIALSLDLNKENNTRRKFRVTSLVSGEIRVKKVSRKQYGIANVVSKKHPRKNVTLINTLKSTKKTVQQSSQPQRVTIIHQNPNHESFQLAHLQPNLQPSTVSYMEFYYWDNSDYSNKGKKISIFTNSKTVQIENKDSVKYKITFLHPPFFLLRSNNVTCNIPSKILQYTANFDKNKYIKFTKDIKKPSARSFGHGYCTPFVLSKLNNNSLSYVTKKETTNVLPQENNDIKSKILPISSKKLSQKYEYTTAYDRVKFFEIYDSDTYPPPSMPLNNKIDIIKNNYEYNQNEIDNVDNNGYGLNLTRFAKKRVTPLDKNNMIFKKYIENNSSTTTTVKNQFETSVSPKFFSYLSQPATWSDYSFVAVYTYEPAEVRCDSASISPHWLVSSAMCLYLHHRDYRTEGRSAFVSYCGNNWRHPERIAYVRRSLLHPSFKPLDKTRRQLYNIGIIQVTNSMANTCNGWHPIPLMTHQFVADRDGTLATAIGWGLDRYDTRYTSSELPLHRLMLYEGCVYSDSCPGNSAYSDAKRLNEESVKNVYCLSLPTYFKEENDTVHGSLLLVEGKLIALYLQEERRPWGKQSAQYTGIWRLIPWLLDVAQEIDEQDPVDTEI